MFQPWISSVRLHDPCRNAPSIWCDRNVNTTHNPQNGQRTSIFPVPPGTNLLPPLTQPNLLLSVLCPQHIHDTIQNFTRSSQASPPRGKREPEPLVDLSLSDNSTAESARWTDQKCYSDEDKCTGFNMCLQCNIKLNNTVSNISYLLRVTKIYIIYVFTYQLQV